MDIFYVRELSQAGSENIDIDRYLAKNVPVSSTHLKVYTPTFMSI